MTRLSKISGANFVQAITDAKVEKKKIGRLSLGGFTVSLTVNINNEQKIIHASRNQLAKFALKLAQSKGITAEEFTQVKDALGRLDQEVEGAGRGTKIKQAIGNRFFKIMNKGKDRATLLNDKEKELKNSNSDWGDLSDVKAELTTEPNVIERVKKDVKERASKLRKDVEYI